MTISGAIVTGCPAMTCVDTATYCEAIIVELAGPKIGSGKNAFRHGFHSVKSSFWFFLIVTIRCKIRYEFRQIRHRLPAVSDRDEEGVIYCDKALKVSDSCDLLHFSVPRLNCLTVFKKRGN